MGCSTLITCGLPKTENRVEGQNHLPQPAGHIFDAAQDTFGLLGCERTLVAHIHLFICQYTQVLLGRAALDLFTPSLY